MSAKPGALRGTPNSFRLAYAAVTAAALALVAVGLLWRQPSPRPKPHPAGDHVAIPSSAWGHALYRTRGMAVTLGPAADRRRRYELAFDRSDIAPAGLLVSNDRGHTYFALQGSPMGRCGFHWQGYGVNAILAARDCVPVWAHDNSGAHAKFWLRVENLVPFARVVFLKYSSSG
jgi:hypothetical protein